MLLPEAAGTTWKYAKTSTNFLSQFEMVPNPGTTLGSSGHIEFRPKAVNLAAWKNVIIDMQEVLSGHTPTGQRAVQSGIKDLFPESMTPAQIEGAIRQAYRYGTTVRVQGPRVQMQGPFGRSIIEFWFNRVTKIIETAYPKVR